MKPVIAKLAPGLISSISNSRSGGAPSYSHRENYGSRTAQTRSHRYPNSDDAIELRSKSDIEFGDRSQNNAWRGEDNAKLSDGESERGVLDDGYHDMMKKRDRDIVKTISVKVEHVNNRTSRSDGASRTKGFEHI